MKPIDNMLAASPFLLTDRPLFVDYNLYGVLGNYLFNGKTRLPNLKHLRRWHRMMTLALSPTIQKPEQLSVQRGKQPRQRRIMKSLGTFSFRKNWDYKNDRQDLKSHR